MFKMKEKCRICKDVLNKDEEDNFCESCTRDMIAMLSEPWMGTTHLLP